MKMLDLCCGAGLAAAGYWRSGCFSEIVGVDIDPAMRGVYPFDFIAGDALALDYDFLLAFDFIHASPPCQFYSRVTPRRYRHQHPRLIPGFRRMLHATDRPHIIENVPGSGHDLRPNLTLSGLDVGLPMDRPRLFRVAVAEKFSSNSFKDGLTVLRQIRNRRAVNVHGSEYVSKRDTFDAFGVNDLPVSHKRNLTAVHVQQGIPPAMTFYLARYLFPRFFIG